MAENKKETKQENEKCDNGFSWGKVFAIGAIAGAVAAAVPYVIDFVEDVIDDIKETDIA